MCVDEKLQNATIIFIYLFFIFLRGGVYNDNDNILFDHNIQIYTTDLQ